MRAAQATAGGWPVTELAAEQAGTDDLLTALYTAHYRELVRLAAFLTSDRDNAEEIVQDAYVKVHGSWRGLRDPDKAEAYLRTAVVNLSRSRLRRRQVVAKHQPEPLRDVASAESHALQTGRRDAVLDALQPAAPPSARSGGAALLRRPDRGADRRSDGLQRRCRQEPHLARDGRAATAAGGRAMSAEDRLREILQRRGQHDRARPATGWR